MDIRKLVDCGPASLRKLVSRRTLKICIKALSRMLVVGSQLLSMIYPGTGVLQFTVPAMGSIVYSKP